MSARKAIPYVLSLSACFLVFFASLTASAQSRNGNTGGPANTSPKGITRSDDPLNRDPLRPNTYDSENSRTGSHSELEAKIKAGNEAREAKPPRLEEAEKAYRRALEINSKEARAYLGLGNVYASQNKVKETIDAFEKALEIRPKLAEAHFNLGMVFAATGKKDQALEHYNLLKPINSEMAKKLKLFLDKSDTK